GCALLSGWFAARYSYDSSSRRLLRARSPGWLGRHELLLLYWRNRAWVKYENTIYRAPFSTHLPNGTDNAARMRKEGMRKEGGKVRESETTLAQVDGAGNCKLIGVASS